MSKMVEITVEEYLDLIELKKRDIDMKLELEFSMLKPLSLESNLSRLDRINELSFEREAILEEIERYSLKFTDFCADDIPF